MQGLDYVAQVCMVRDLYRDQDLKGLGSSAIMASQGVYRTRLRADEAKAASAGTSGRRSPRFLSGVHLSLVPWHNIPHHSILWGGVADLWKRGFLSTEHVKICSVGRVAGHPTPQILHPMLDDLFDGILHTVDGQNPA